jgi:signal transduction histidine kinase
MRRRLPVVGDLAVSVAVLAVSLPSGGTAAETALAAAAAVVLLARRARPVAVAGVVLVLTVLSVVVGAPVPALAGPLVAVLTVAVQRPLRTSLATAAVTAVAVAGPVVALSDDAGVERLRSPGLAVALLVAAWALGALSRTRRQTLAALRARADLVERDRDLTVALAVERERSRIMREMHDVVGHSLSVIAVQADAAGAVLARDPAAAATAMSRVGAVAREALTEVRAVIGAARGDPAPGDTAPGDVPRGDSAVEGGVAEGPVVPDLSRLGSLVATAREAGTPVRVEVAGDVGTVGPARSSTAYRIVQESLTNVRRHGGPGAGADVAVTVTPDALDVVVRSTGRAGAADREPDRVGTGIAAMRERAALVGGTLSAGWASGEVFEVSAHLPRAAPEVP